MRVSKGYTVVKTANCGAVSIVSMDAIKCTRVPKGNKHEVYGAQGGLGWEMKKFTEGVT